MGHVQPNVQETGEDCLQYVHTSSSAMAERPCNACDSTVQG